ncbi:MAG: hypothetical protein IJS26_05625 [Alphaproteobacteria bacterium]|nr:hypothetical protein [Alphaproteobacteria bacterium]
MSVFGLIGSICVLLLSLRLLFATEFGKMSLEYVETVKKATCWSPEVHVIHRLKTTLLEQIAIVSLVPVCAATVAFYVLLISIF